MPGLADRLAATTVTVVDPSFLCDSRVRVGSTGDGDPAYPHLTDLSPHGR